MGKLSVHIGWRVGGAVLTVKSVESISLYVGQRFDLRGLRLKSFLGNFGEFRPFLCIADFHLYTTLNGCRRKKGMSKFYLVLSEVLNWYNFPV